MTFNLTMYKENLPLMLLSLYPNKTVLTVTFIIFKGLNASYVYKFEFLQGVDKIL